MQVEVYKPSRRAILRSEAFASTLYGKACHEKWKDMRHRALEYRIQHDPAFKLTPEQEVEHEEWRAKHGIKRPPQREV